MEQPKKKMGVGKILLIVLAVIVGVFLLLLVIGMLTGGEEETAQSAQNVQSALPQGEKPAGESWTIMLYLCGTDLESNNGACSYNLQECAAVDLPENVRVLICTGGTRQWQLDFADPNYIEYHHLSGAGDIETLKQNPSASMGDANTLGSFLRFGVENYPADKYAAVLWNHGGGNDGVVFDELYGNDNLTLPDLKEGFSQAGAKLEFIGFDACLMATLENALYISPYASYMVASEESEPGAGWDYTAWLSYLAKNPGANGADVGKVICDSFLKKCGDWDESCTLSVCDLSKVNALGAAFDDMAAEMTGLTGDVDSFKTLTSEISRAENYGGNTDEDGYFNLVDIGDMVLNAKSVLSRTGEEVLNALFDAVVYNVHGAARANANGISAFYPIKADAYALDDYAQNAAFSRNYLTYLSASRKGWDVPADFTGMDFQNAEAEAPQSSAAQADFTIDAGTWLDDDDGTFHLDVNAGIEYVTNVYFTLYQMDYDYNEYMFMGRDDDLHVTEDGAHFSDNFRGVWPALNGVFVDLELLEATDDYNLYSIPILLNGEEMNLRAMYEWSTGEYRVLGAVKGSGGNTFASRKEQTLQDGDTVKVLMTGSNWDSGDDTTYSVGSFTVQGEVTLAEEELADGDYLYQYEMVDVLGETYYSGSVVMECRDGQISVYEAEEE